MKWPWGLGAGGADDPQRAAAEDDWRRLREQQQSIAQQQALHLHIDPASEARAIAASCGLDRSPPPADAFGRATLTLLQYPLPSGYLVMNALAGCVAGPETAARGELLGSVCRAHHILRERGQSAPSAAGRWSGPPGPARLLGALAARARAGRDGLRGADFALAAL